MHVHVNMCMQYKTTLYKSEMIFISLTDPFMLEHGERERYDDDDDDDDDDDSRSK